MGLVLVLLALGATAILEGQRLAGVGLVVLGVIGVVVWMLESK